MIQNKRVYALIPARGGSKGIPNKSIVDLCGKPLMAYSIEQAFESKYVDRVVVSTDDEKMAKVALAYNADVPFMRPQELALDESSSSSFILHALKFFKEEEKLFPDILVLLQPTSPLRTCDDIDKALELFVSSNVLSLESLCKPDISPYWFKTVDENNLIKPFLEKPASYIRRQDTNDLYMVNGAIYIFCADNFLKGTIEIGRNALAYVMPVERSIDIDNMLDLEFAEFLLKRGQN